MGENGRTDGHSGEIGVPAREPDGVHGDGRVQRFEVVRTLGRGGLGAVLEVHDRLARRNVALKHLLADRSDDGARRGSVRTSSRGRELLENEYHTLKQLQHPSIIEAYDYGIDDDLGPYYTMQLLTGQDLHELAPLPWRDACQILMDLASSLAVVHSRRLVHRDVTARNVRRTASGSAKLLDFGALTEMGAPASVVGTPPYMAPECLHRQPLDGRTDLYSLGALAYLLLSGRHAYPTRRLEHLQQAWQTRPRPLAAYMEDVPGALSDLVAALLHLDPLARPQAAFEVMARLSSIAEIPLVESHAIRAAYLATPKLVGRDPEVRRMRKLATRVAQGRSCVLCISGPPGTGRSRALDACVLEAQLTGARVVRADAKEGERNLAVVGRIAAQLARYARAGANEISAALADWLASAVDSEGQHRPDLLAALQTLALSSSRHEPLAIAVDDVDRIDAPSRAWLAGLALAKPAGHLMLVYTVATEARAPVFVDALPRPKSTIELSPLEAEDTRALLVSVFGDVPNLDLVSGLVHAACAGHPREIMDAAQRLVDDGIAHYESGGWFLRNDPDLIRASIESGIDVSLRLDALSDDAVAVLHMLALDRDYRVASRHYGAVCEIEDPGRVRRAVSELVQDRWLVPSDRGHRFARPSERAGVRERMAPGLARALHERLARYCSRDRESPIYETYHWLQAGVPEHVHPSMKAFAEIVESEPNRVRHAVELDTLADLIEAGVKQQWPLGLLTRYRTLFVLQCAALGEWRRIVPVARPTLEALARSSGLVDHAELDSIPESERFAAALARARARFDQADPPGAEIAPDEAIRALPKVAIVVAITARYLFESHLFDAIPDFGPLRRASPAIHLSQRIIDEYFRAVSRGAHWQSWRAAGEILAEVRALPEDQVDARTRYTLELVSLGACATDDARHAAADTLARCDELAAKQNAQAENYRSLYHLACGDFAKAEASRRRSEVLSLHAGAGADVRRQRIVDSIELHPLADDLVGLRRLEEELASLQAIEPSWRFAHARARGHRLRCQGQIEEALEGVEQALVELAPSHQGPGHGGLGHDGPGHGALGHQGLGHYEWCPMAELHVLLLREAGRSAQAVRLGREYLASAERLSAPTAWLELALARACAREGEHDAARGYVEHALAAFDAHGVLGIHLGYAHEVGALVALDRDDHAAFRLHTERCGELYLRGGSPELTAKHARLLAHARARFGSRDASDSAGEDAGTHTGVSGTSEPRSGRSLFDSLDPLLPLPDALLAWVCARTGAVGGALLGLRGERLHPIAGAADDELVDTASDYVSAELEESPDVTITATLSATVTSTPSAQGDASEPTGTSHRPTLLSHEEAGRRLVAGVLMLRFPNDATYAHLEHSLLEELSRTLVERGLAEPTTTTL